MKKLLIIFACLFNLSSFAADIYRLDPEHTNITWSANHFGFSSPSGKFTKAEGVIILNESEPQLSTVEVTIATSSIMTGVDRLDSHLKSEDFFNVAKFPTAKFVSKEISITGVNSAKIKGDFTLLGTTKPIILEARLNKLGIHPITQDKTAGFSAAAIIKRSDFGMIFGAPGVADNVKLNIEVEAMFSSSQTIAEAPTDEVKKITYIANPQWRVIPQESSISFTAKQGQSIIKGTFNKLDGKIIFDKNQTKGNKVNIEVDTSSLSMSFADAFETLKGEPWLAISSFPKASFSAEEFTPLSNNKMQARGQLTIKNKTVPINFNFEFTKYSKTESVAVGSFKVNRKDFGIGNGAPNQASVDEDVIVTFNIKAQK
jgi:polyisoprenoid-binding protein YceI